MEKLRVLGITLYLTLIQSVCFAEGEGSGTSADAAKAETFNQLQEIFMKFGVDGAYNLQNQALYLIGVFAVISLCTTWALYTGEWQLQQMVGVIIKTSFFIMLAISWTDILAMIFEGFRTAGLVAAGGAADSELLTPSGIVSQGDVLTIELGKSLAKGVAPSGASNPIQLLIDTFSMAPKMVMVMITLFVVKACFFWMAFSLVLVNIEFAMFTCITMLMMPFGMLRWTETYFNKAVNGVFHFGIKMMVLYFLLKLLMSNTETFTWMSKTAAPIGSTIGFGDLINHMALIFLTALLVWLLPELAAGLLDGTPNMSAGSAVAGAGRAAGLGRIGYSYGKSGAQAVYGAGRAVARSKKVQKAAAWVGKWLPH